MFRYQVSIVWFPPGLENLEKCEGISQLGKSQGILPKILEKSEKLYWKIEKKNTGKVREICQPVNSENPGSMIPYFRLKRKTIKNAGKHQKYWKSQGNLSV